jgi:hypothetical protein
MVDRRGYEVCEDSGCGDAFGFRSDFCGDISIRTPRISVCSTVVSLYLVAAVAQFFIGIAVKRIDMRSFWGIPGPFNLFSVAKTCRPLRAERIPLEARTARAPKDPPKNDL